MAILQVVDMNDRIVSTQAISGNTDFHVMAERTSEGLHTTHGLLAVDLGLLWGQGCD
ncbi:MAG: hypothetical protein IJK78_05250 [Bacteroidales bacterium]|nr:hypothetical protein [Bacteroidales bacterium]